MLCRPQLFGIVAESLWPIVPRAHDAILHPSTPPTPKEAGGPVEAAALSLRRRVFFHDRHGARWIRHKVLPTGRLKQLSMRGATMSLALVKQLVATRKGLMQGWYSCGRADKGLGEELGKPPSAQPDSPIVIGVADRRRPSFIQSSQRLPNRSDPDHSLPSSIATPNATSRVREPSTVL